MNGVGMKGNPVVLFYSCCDIYMVYKIKNTKGGFYTHSELSCIIAFRPTLIY